METKAADTTLHQLLAQAEAESKKDPRAAARFPFFRQVSIETGGRRVSGFTRDMCATSIGLLHNQELPLGEADVLIPIATDSKCKLRVDIKRCERCGDGWFISGGKFVGIAAAEEVDDELLNTLITARD